MKLLLVEDDEAMARYVATGLRTVGHDVERVVSGTDGLRLAKTHQHDILIVDRMIPEMDGLEMVKRLRSAGTTTPVLFLTTMDGIDDRVQGLEGGADDYLVKPFALAELAARLAALGRRSSGHSNATVLKAADLEIDLIKRTVTRNGERIELQPREFQLLEYLMRYTGQVVTRNMLLENVWDFHFDPQTNIVETHISRLRSKIDKGFSRTLIHTIRGNGYMLK